MRHRISGKKLGRTAQQRNALFRSLLASLIRYGFVETTQGRGKSMLPLIDKLVTVAKKKTLASRRQVQATLQNKSLTTLFVDRVVPSFSAASGFVRWSRQDVRRGDAAPVVCLKFVEQSAYTTTEKKEKIENIKEKEQQKEHKEKKHE